MTKITDEIKEELRKNSLLPANERLTDNEFAKKFGLSRATVVNTKHRIGLQTKCKPTNAIGTDKASLAAFLKEYDEAGFGGKKALMNKYGFKSLHSIHSTITQIRRKLCTI